MKIWKILVMGLTTFAVATLFWVTLTFGHFDENNLTRDYTVVLLACAGIWVAVFLAINPPWRRG